jgi:hypothetical protein
VGCAHWVHMSVRAAMRWTNNKVLTLTSCGATEAGCGQEGRVVGVAARAPTQIQVSN